MRILIYGDHFNLTTGYARNIKDILPFLTKHHDVRQVSLDYNGLPLSDTIKCYPTKLPKINDHWATEILYYALEDFKPDIVLTVQDFFMLRKIAFNMAHPGNWKWVHWGTLDGSPLDYSCREAIKWVDYIFYYSEFAKKEVEKVYPKIQGEVVYPPINPNSFYVQDKERLRKQYGLEGRKILVNCGRNQMRKNVPILLDSLVELRKTYPEIILILASNVNPTSEDGVKDGYEFDLFIEDRGLQDVILSPRRKDGMPIDDQMLNIQYNLADVMVHTSWGEGFGLPIAEAGLCKVPTIGVDCSAISEVVGKGGILVKPRAYSYTQAGTKYSLTTPEDITKAVNKFYNLSKEQREQMGVEARNFSKQLKPESVATQMLNAFDRIRKNEITSLAKS
jgi:glycosyltransferase involved in cell wall biosynthesis